MASHYTTAIFPKSLDGNQRKTVHVTAKDYQLISKSIGGKDERFVFVHKNISKEEMNRRQKKQWHHIPVGPTFIVESLDTTIYLGSGVDARQRTTLEKLGIAYVINCSRKWEDEEFEGVAFEKCFLPERSSEDDYDEVNAVFERVFEVIENARSITSATTSYHSSNHAAILLHCIDGNSKSAVVLMAYLIKYHSMSLHSAFDLIKERRPHVSPPTHLMRHLVHFEVLTRGGSPSMTLKDWVVPAVAKVDQPSLSSAHQKRGISRVAKEEIALQWVPLEKLLNSATIVCDSDFQEGKLEAFVEYMLLNLKNDYLLQQEMSNKGFEWHDIEQTIIDRIKDWFMDRVHQHNSSRNALKKSQKDIKINNKNDNNNNDNNNNNYNDNKKKNNKTINFGSFIKKENEEEEEEEEEEGEEDSYDNLFG